MSPPAPGEVGRSVRGTLRRNVRRGSDELRRPSGTRRRRGPGPRFRCVSDAVEPPRPPRAEDCHETVAPSPKAGALATRSLGGVLRSIHRARRIGAGATPVGRIRGSDPWSLRGDRPRQSGRDVRHRYGHRRSRTRRRSEHPHRRLRESDSGVPLVPGARDDGSRDAGRRIELGHRHERRPSDRRVEPHELGRPPCRRMGAGGRRGRSGSGRWGAQQRHRHKRNRTSDWQRRI